MEISELSNIKSQAMIVLLINDASCHRGAIIYTRTKLYAVPSKSEISVKVYGVIYPTDSTGQASYDES